jgi:hypothetical protein
MKNWQSNLACDYVQTHSEILGRKIENPFQLTNLSAFPAKAVANVSGSDARFEVFTEVQIQVEVVWDVSQCSKDHTYTYKHTHALTHSRARTHTYIHTHIHKYIHIHTHTHTHTHTQERLSKVSGLAASSEKCKWYSSLPLDAAASLFCESV